MKEELVNSGKSKIKDFVRNNKDFQADPAIRSAMNSLQVAYREFDSTQFIVLVVGAVKSGKSTLVNLFAHEMVSPTHFLECTVRPSIISKDSERKILQYTLKPGNDRVEAFNSVVDYVRGIGDKNELEAMTEQKAYDLNPHNLSLYVELNMNEDNIKNDDTLITNITTEGGNLLNGETVIIDMPGLDGGYANFDDPVYQEIAERADIIIFVQSSNSAITKISKEFLDLLAEKNRKVPVCLVHNVFDARYWESENEKSEQIKTQIEIAKNRIRSSGFNILESFALNLGKVTDAELYPDDEDLRKEKRKFEDMEKILFRTIKEKRDQIHEEICVYKVANAADRLIARVDERHSGLENEKQRLEQLYNKFEQFINAYKNTGLLKEEMAVEIKNIFEDKRQGWEQEIDSLAGICKKNIAEKEKTFITRERISIFAEDATSVVMNYLESEECHKYLNLKVNSKIKSFYLQQYSDLVEFFIENGITSFRLPEVDIAEIFSFTFNGEEQTIPTVYKWGGRSRQEVCEIINSRKDIFIGYTEQGKRHQGKLQQSVIPEMNKFYIAQAGHKIDEFAGKVCEMIAEKKNDKIPEYIRLKESIDKETDALNEMSAKLNDIHNIFHIVKQKYFEQ